MTDNYTPSGKPTEEARDDHATLSGGRFPIFDEHSAKAALSLRGHTHSAAEREAVIAHAAKFDPEAAAKARAEDAN